MRNERFKLLTEKHVSMQFYYGVFSYEVFILKYSITRKNTPS